MTPRRVNSQARPPLLLMRKQWPVQRIGHIRYLLVGSNFVSLPRRLIEMVAYTGLNLLLSARRCCVWCLLVYMFNFVPQDV